MLFETIFRNCRENFENKEGKKCILPLFDTMFWPAMKMLKAMKLNGAFWHFCKPMLNDFWGGLPRLRPPLNPLVRSAHTTLVYVHNADMIEKKLYVQCNDLNL